MAENTPASYTGDPDFAERKFTDHGPWLPPTYMVDDDPYFKEALTYSTVSIEEAANTPAGVATPNVEPGGSEFSWGRGLMAPMTKGHVPTQIEEMKAVMRTNSADPGASHLDRYADWIRES